MRSTLLYTLQRNVYSLAWIGPTVAFMVVIVALTPFGAPFASTAAAMGVMITLISAWLAWTALTVEDTAHQSMVAVVAAGRVRARLAQLLASYVVSLVLLAVGAIVAVVRAVGFRSEQPLLLQLLLCLPYLASLALLGVAIASLFAWPVVKPAALSGSLTLVTTISVTVVPGSPVPLGLLALAEIGSYPDVAQIAWHAVGALLSAGAIFAAAASLTVRRWRLSSE